MNIKSFIACFMVLAGLLSCQKKDSTMVGEEEVNITITSPLEGQVFKSGDTVYIKAEISYKSQLHGYVAQVKDKSSGMVVYDGENHTHDSKLAVSEYWIADSTRNAELTLTTVIDHEEHKRSKALSFRVQP